MNDRNHFNDVDDIKQHVQNYYADVLTDFEELKDEYPFSYLTIPPTDEPEKATIYVIAAHKDLIESCHAIEEDFKGRYSKELRILIPADYKKTGCKIYGGTWIDIDQIPEQHRHIYPLTGDYRKFGYEFCVGVPASFSKMSNVILENIRTAEHLLIAYENYLCGNTKTIVIEEYSHGDKGIIEYVKENKYKRHKD